MLADWIDGFSGLSRGRSGRVGKRSAANSLSSDCLRFLEKVIEQTIVKRLD
jgi:hypothetical protein